MSREALVTIGVVLAAVLLALLALWLVDLYRAQQIAEIPLWAFAGGSR